MGHPVNVYTPEKLAEINKAMNEYTEKTIVPILAEFSYNCGILREEMYRHSELRYAIKRLMTKKESQLEKLGMTNKVNATFAIFSLKQLGWRDRHEVESTVIIKNKSDLEKLPDDELRRLAEDG